MREDEIAGVHKESEKYKRVTSRSCIRQFFAARRACPEVEVLLISSFLLSFRTIFISLNFSTDRLFCLLFHQLSSNLLSFVLFH